MESFVAIYREPLEHTPNSAPKCPEFISHMSHTNTPGKPPARVLCIDDNCDVLQLEKEILEEAGYEVLLASNGTDGLNIATGSMIDIVILDCEMPQMTGTEVAHRIRAMRPMLPIIMVSGAGQPNETTGIVDCFVPKTQVPTTLVREVKRFLRRWSTSLLL